MTSTHSTEPATSPTHGAVPIDPLLAGSAAARHREPDIGVDDGQRTAVIRSAPALRTRSLPAAWTWIRARAARGVPRPSVATAYLLVAVPAAVAFAFLIPPSQGLDESAHFMRVWQIAGGNIVMDTRVDPNSGLEVNGGTYDLCVREYLDEFTAIAATPEPYDVGDYWTDTPDCSPRRRGEFFGEAMGSYSIWAYPGQSVGVAIGRGVGFPLPVTFFFGRLLGVVTALGLCWHAIRVAPRAKLVLATVALLPMSLMAASVYSPDGVVLGTSLILIAYALRFATTDARLTRRDVVVIGVALTALALTKAPYVLLALLFLTYRRDAAGSRRATVRTLAAVTAVPLLLAGIWNRVGYPQGAVETYRPGIDQAGQVKWILQHPVPYLNVLSDTIFHWETQEFVIKGWVGAFGMFRFGVADSPLMIPIFVLVAAAALGAFTALEAGPRLAASGIWQRVRSWIPLLTLVLAVLAIYTSAYVAWDAVGAQRIYGVQGRYFIPLLPLPAVALALRHERSTSSIGTRGVVLVAAVLLTAAFFKIGTYFY